MTPAPKMSTSDSLVPVSVTSHLSKWPSSKRTKIINVEEDVEKKEPLYIVGGNVNRCCLHGKYYDAFLSDVFH